MLVVCMMCVGWIREGLLSWFTSYLEEVFDVRVGASLHTICATGITLGGSECFKPTRCFYFSVYSTARSQRSIDITPTFAPLLTR